jgi:16S rRNA G1207 methylase RsmC
MTAQLSNEEKISVVNQHKRAIEYSKYNLTVSLIEENAVLNKDQDAIDSLTAKIADHDGKLSALDAELDSLV